MNFITHTRAYSLYPYSTHCDKSTMVCGPTTSKILHALKKYEERRWMMINNLSINMMFLHPKSEWNTKYRRIGDQYCWSRQINPVNYGWLKNEFSLGSWFKWGIRFCKFPHYGDVLEGVMKPMEWVFSGRLEITEE